MTHIYDIFLCLTIPTAVFIAGVLTNFHVFLLGIIGQIPGGESVVKAAAETQRWEAVALAVIMLSVTGFLVYIVKKLMDQALEREKQQTKRIDDLENYIRTTLMDVVKDHTKVMAALMISNEATVATIKELVDSLHTTRPCFMAGEQQSKMIDEIGNKIVDHIKLTQIDKK